MSGNVLRPRRRLSSRSVPGAQWQRLCLSTEAPALKRFGAFREIKPHRRLVECKFLETAAFEFGSKAATARVWRRERHRSTRKAASVFRRRYPEMPHESPPHPFVIAEPRPLRYFDYAADFLAFEQQPRGLHPQRLDPACGRHSGAGGIGARKSSRAHSGFFGERLDFEIAGDILDNPGMQRAETPLHIRRLRCQYGRELALAAGAFEKHHQPSRDVQRSDV